MLECSDPFREISLFKQHSSQLDENQPKVWNPHLCLTVLWHPCRCPAALWHPHHCPAVLWHPRCCPAVLWHPHRCPAVLWHPRECGFGRSCHCSHPIILAVTQPPVVAHGPTAERGRPTLSLPGAQVSAAMSYWTSADFAGGEYFRFYANGKSIVRVHESMRIAASVPPPSGHP